VPGHSSACSGPGGCLSSQVCNASGTAYGSCECAQPTDASVVLCIPGESTACTGPGGCPSSQVCNASGTAYDACDCTPRTPPAGRDGGTLPDGYAPLPASLGTQGYDAIWAADPNQVPEVTWILRPLFSAPDCAVVPPFGETLVAAFKPTTAGPTGTFPACGENGPSPCYETERMTWDGAYNWETVPGGMLTLSAFNADGIATGMMDTSEGIVPLAVKKCP
jgi:hypothetical protein